MRGFTNVPPQADGVNAHAATHYAGGNDPIDLSKLGAIPATDKGKANGVATLGEDGNVPRSQLGNAVNKTGDTMTGPLVFATEKGYGSRVLNTKAVHWTEHRVDELGNVVINNVDGTDENLPFSQMVIGPESNPFIQFGYGRKSTYEAIFEIIHSANIRNYALPRDGSEAMTGPLVVANGGQMAYVGLNIDAEETYLNHIKGNEVQQIAFNKDGARFDSTIDGVHWSSGTLLHTTNKPSGSYTGNGSDAERVILIGGIGHALAIWSITGVVLITSSGGFYGYNNNAFSHFPSEIASFVNGVLTLHSSFTVFNTNGQEYFYEVL